MKRVIQIFTMTLMIALIGQSFIQACPVNIEYYDHASIKKLSNL